MAHTRGNSLVQWLVAALFIAMLGGGAKAAALCDIDSTKLSLCYAAVTGNHPPKPNEKCCAVVRHANLPCLCSYKSILPSVGINPTNALALPGKCGLETPPECRQLYDVSVSYLVDSTKVLDVLIFKDIRRCIIPLQFQFAICLIK
ncbi:hypothetical protein RJT34_00539 [Clitoria ternatea]|uniref:Bifunctional inhibitor/plant lipid transfer protein/seed storage helical domain-containing protein n=1 Tax=Clitoria ternatea TaxID=43366 RepID=A0AAN9KI37_CLITE